MSHSLLKHNIVGNQKQKQILVFKQVTLECSSKSNFNLAIYDTIAETDAFT